MILTKEPEHVIEVFYEHVFTWRNSLPVIEFGFPCTPDGTVDVAALQPSAAAGYRKCLSREHDVIDEGIWRWERHYTLPGEGKCDRCGRVVKLADVINTCDCGADYDVTGNLLPPCHLWEEETNEHWRDMVRRIDV